MRIRGPTLTIALVAALSMVTGGSMIERGAKPADPLAPPSRTTGEGADVASDIADIFLWNDATTVKIIMTTAGPQVAGTPPTFDKDVLYQLNISNTGDPTTTQL